MGRKLFIFIHLLLFISFQLIAQIYNLLVGNGQFFLKLVHWFLHWCFFLLWRFFKFFILAFNVFNLSLSFFRNTFDFIRTFFLDLFKFLLLANLSARNEFIIFFNLDFQVLILLSQQGHFLFKFNSIFHKFCADIISHSFLVLFFSFVLFFENGQLTFEFFNSFIFQIHYSFKVFFLIHQSISFFFHFGLNSKHFFIFSKIGLFLRTLFLL